MPVFNNHPFFNNEQLAALRQTFDVVCGDLGLNGAAETAERRDRVAHLIMQMANDGELDGEVLRSRAVLHFGSEGTRVKCQEVAGG